MTEESYRALLDASLDCFVVFDDQGQIIEFNAAAERVFGYSRAEAVERGMDELLVPAALSESFSNLLRLDADEIQEQLLGRRFETTARCCDGRVIPIEASFGRSEINGRSLFIVSMRDLSGQREAEEEKRRTEGIYQQLVENTSDIIALFDLDGSLQFVSPSLLGTLGFAPEELIGGNFLSTIHPDDVEEALAMIKAAYKGEDVLTARVRLQHKLGHWIHVECSADALKDEEGKPLSFVGIGRDLSERMRHNDELRLSEHRYHDLFENANDLIIIADLEERVVEVNSAFERTCGYSRDEFVGRKLLDFLTPESQAAVLEMTRRKLEDGGTTTFEVDLQAKSGEYIPFEVSSRLSEEDGKPVAIQAILRDLTERKRFEDQLRQSQKMDAVGQLAGGVAHDFNNLLTAIVGYTEFALERAQHDDELASDLTEIQDAANRARGLTGQLLAFSRRQMSQPRPLSLNDSVVSIEKLLRRLLGEHIEIKVDLAADLGLTLADPGQLEQVLVNLAVNARDAMAEGGSLVIETRNVSLDREISDLLGPGEYVTMAVSDNGSGMAAEVLSRIFEPFYTTKEVGQGTGLGLSTVYGIVAQTGGEVIAYSEPGVGSTFTVYLPLTDQPTIQEEPNMQNENGGAESILLVEDEDVVRRLVRQMLERQGYSVIDAEDPEKALQIAEENGGDFDLLVTDVVMPKMNGRELATRLTAAHPSLKVLYTSGYTANAIKTNGQLDTDMVMLQKPFTMQDLATKVREVLDTPLA